MLEYPNIQSRGFRNIKEGNTISGFQVPVRLANYRGVWLPMLRPATIKINGETYEGDQITWVIDGKQYEQSELPNFPDVQWSSMDVATLKVKKPGGLPLGIYDVEVMIIFSSSYLPPRVDLGFGETYKRRMTLVR